MKFGIHIEILTKYTKDKSKRWSDFSINYFNDNADVTSLPYLILCYTGPIFYIVNENELRICYNIKK